MYQTLLYFHSLIRWLLVVGLLYSIFRAYKGYVSNLVFSKTDNALRHWTATIAHVQLMIGIILYVNSPVVKYFWSNFKEGIRDFDSLFFGLIHIVLMLTAVVAITIGSALAKRRETDKEKFRTMLVWFLITAMIILVAIPWPFSPLATRPYIR